MKRVLVPLRLPAAALLAGVSLTAATARAEDAAPPTEASAQPPSPPAATAPLVELTADEGHATIERRTATSSPAGLGLLETGAVSVGHWEHACVAPCQVRLDPRFAYRVAGDGLVPTETFALPRGEDRVRVDAKMGSAPARVGGMLLTGGGVLALAAGGAALLATPILASEDIGSEGFRSAVLAGGIGAAGVGIVAVTVGLFMWMTNSSTARTELAPRAVSYAR